MFHYLILSFQIKKYLQVTSWLTSAFAEFLGPEGFPCHPTPCQIMLVPHKILGSVTQHPHTQLIHKMSISKSPP